MKTNTEDKQSLFRAFYSKLKSDRDSEAGRAVGMLYSKKNWKASGML